jgi:hypothetical protein
MNRIRHTASPTAIILIISLLLVSNIYESASAAMIETDRVLRAENASEARTFLHQTIDRQDVREALIAQGVDPLEAHNRIDSLTDEEVSRIYGNIDDLAAGQGVIIFSMIILGAIIATFLLFTLFPNVTDVFP